MQEFVLFYTVILKQKSANKPVSIMTITHLNMGAMQTLVTLFTSNVPPTMDNFENSIHTIK
jgi:SLT domain-containing protein